MTFQGYDLVGDIHGHADALHRLLHKLDYTEVEGVLRKYSFDSLPPPKDDFVVPVAKATISFTG